MIKLSETGCKEDLSNQKNKSEILILQELSDFNETHMDTPK